jgi:membrane peptidoglycan carboxypeptidase
MAWGTVEGPYQEDGRYQDDGRYQEQRRGAEPGPFPPRRPRRPVSRKRRILKRLAFTAVTLVALVVIAFASLLLLTPSASDATRLTAQQARDHGIAYPGPAAPANFAKPLIATEDKRFYSDPGIDPFAVARLAGSEITGNTSDEGGATLEQQLAKLLYTPGQGGVATEIKQVAIAVKLNFTYSKAQILQMYAEVAYYGHGYYGLEAASCGYFGHPASELTPVQGAMLAGVVNAPTVDDPIDDPVNAHARLTHVIGRMVAVGDITQAQGNKLVDTPLGLGSGAGCPV